MNRPLLLLLLCGALAREARSETYDLGVPPPADIVLLRDAPSLRQVQEWALGARTRPAPVPPADLVRVRTTSQRPPPPPETKKVAATSLLPAPPGDDRIFLVKEGRLHVLRWEDAAPRPLVGGAPALHLKQLLASSGSGPTLRLYVVAVPAGEPELWLMDLRGEVITRQAKVGAGDLPRTREGFFAVLRAPRCQRGGSRCLEIEARAGKSYLRCDGEELRSLGEVEAAAPAWGDAQGEHVLLLARQVR